MNSIYERIEFMIKKQGISKKSFCEQLAISAGNFGDWKRGKSTPGTSKLIEISKYFDVSLDWLMTGREWSDRVKESAGEYEVNPVQLLEEKQNELSLNEKSFIKEYIDFTLYRKQGKGK